jgi:DNA-binding beta-propeller fold protein YncE
MRRTRATLACAALVAASLTGFAPTTPVAGSVGGTGTVMFVGNNWDGTADLVDPTSFTTVGTLNVIPDYQQRMAEIQADPVRLAYFLAIRQQVGEGHDQYVDDMFSTADGSLVAVSRPSFADVVGIDLRSRKITWRFAMHGQRADHMAISPDGSRLLVSDSTANHVDELDIRTGRALRQFASGDTPHESNYSADGSRIFHASIGRIYTPTDPSQFCPLTDPTKGDQRFEIVDTASFQILQSWDIGQKLRDAGFPCMSSAVRPMAISPDEKTAYLQISFLHGYVVFDLEQGVVRQVVSLPESEHSQQTPKSQYVLNSAHHGLAINAAGTDLCVAGTMDDYVGLVPIANPGSPTILSLPHVGDRPYWATNGPDATQCWVSVAGDDRVNVYDYASRTRVASVKVGDHPQRVRVGHVSAAALAAWRTGTSTFVPPAR